MGVLPIVDTLALKVISLANMVWLTTKRAKHKRVVDFFMTSTIWMNESGLQKAICKLQIQPGKVKNLC